MFAHWILKAKTSCIISIELVYMFVQSSYYTTKHLFPKKNPAAPGPYHQA
jgi:hypothetical protein